MQDKATKLTYVAASSEGLAVPGTPAQGKVVMVSGAGRGIGRSIAMRFAQGGCDTVVLAARSVDQLETTAVEVRNLGARAFPVAIDVGNVEAVEQLLNDVRSRFGRLDVLINNAGVCISGSIDTFKPSEYFAQNRVNLDGVFLMTHYAWPLLRESGDGVVINISSRAAQDPFPGLEIYGGTKACVNAWTLGWAREGARCGVRVYAIGPGATDTQMLRQLFPNLPAEACISPDDVAELAHTLSGPAGKYISGTTIYIGK